MPTLAAPGPAATTVMPPAAGATQAMPVPMSTSVMSPTARRGRAVVVVIVLIVVAAVAAVIVATMRSVNNSGSSVKHGKPHLQQPLERDVRHLENLVTP